MNPAKRRAAIEERLKAHFSSADISVIDDSAAHRGHPGATDGRGHFIVTIVSNDFRDLSRIARHRKVYEALGELMQTDVHALAIHAHTTEEF